MLKNGGAGLALRYRGWNYVHQLQRLAFGAKPSDIRYDSGTKAVMMNVRDENSYDRCDDDYDQNVVSAAHAFKKNLCCLSLIGIPSRSMTWSMSSQTLRFSLKAWLRNRKAG